VTFSTNFKWEQETRSEEKARKDLEREAAIDRCYQAVDLRDKSVCRVTGEFLTAGASDPRKRLERHHMVRRGDLRFEFQGQQRAFCLKSFGAGGCVDVEIREHREKRTDRQNRALWALLSEWCSKAHQGWYPDDLKDVMLARVFGTIERTQPLTGEIIRVPAEPHSSRLGVSKFCQLIEAILETAAMSEPSVYLMAPDEYRIAKEKARKLEARRAIAA